MRWKVRCDRPVCEHPLGFKEVKGSESLKLWDFNDSDPLKLRHLKNFNDSDPLKLG